MLYDKSISLELYGHESYRYLSLGTEPGLDGKGAEA